MKPRLVVIGNGMAGMRTVEELLALAPDLYEITVLGREPHGNYNRIQLSSVLAGDKQLHDIMLHPRAWYAQHGIALHLDDAAVQIDRGRRCVRTRSDHVFTYDRLLIATGSRPFVLPVPGCDLQGVTGFRDHADVQAMQQAARTHRKAVVIGGGLLGLEAASGLLRQGMQVTVVHLHAGLMERQLDPAAAGLLQKKLAADGMRFVLGARTAALLGGPRVQGLRFEDGSEIEADLVVMAAGVHPDIGLARDTGLYCERAIVVDDTLQTYDPRIYAVGECVQHRQATFGLVAPLWEQARVCAAHLAGAGHRRYQQQAQATRLKVRNVDLYAAGDLAAAQGCDSLVLSDPGRGIYKRLLLQGDRLAAAVLYGDVADGPWYFDLIQQQTPVAGLRQRLLFGQTICAPADHEALAG
ncbi:NAD(P)/FAD-dependent oxidoreductase [Comamonas composti]|uniref:NAD(P)/FAD-dependent oxidoreductase n=1 Tax=Comamonas composti TaxID=408558 RepID=UPI00040FFE98|nr:FAD-dependent oxidoreductase [Comamonas composti]